MRTAPQFLYISRHQSTILLADEGINGPVAGSEKTILELLDYIKIDVHYANIILNNTSGVKMLLDQINKLKMGLSSEQTRDASKHLTLNIERKNFPSEKLGLLLGLFLGGMLGFFVSLFRNMKSN
jgi:hypothetical protein